MEPALREAKTRREIRNANAAILVVTPTRRSTGPATAAFGHLRGPVNSALGTEMTSGRYIGTVFWVVLLLIWLPWTGWYATDTYVFGHEDTKFGRDGGVVFVAVMYAYIAITSAVCAAVLRVFDALFFEPVSHRQVLMASAGAGVSLSVISPAALDLGLPWFPEILGIVLGWASISLVVAIVFFGAVRRLPAKSGAADDLR